MKTFTPGPWFIDKNEAQVDINRHRHLYWEIGSDDVGISIVVAPTEDATAEVKAERLATATLIAAAPCLLAALEEVVAIADRKTDAFDRAKAAIAKAKGAAGNPGGRG